MGAQERKGGERQTARTNPTRDKGWVRWGGGGGGGGGWGGNRAALEEASKKWEEGVEIRRRLSSDSGLGSKSSAFFWGGEAENVQKGLPGSGGGGGGGAGGEGGGGGVRKNLDQKKSCQHAKGGGWRKWEGGGGRVGHPRDCHDRTNQKVIRGGWGRTGGGGGWGR